MNLGIMQTQKVLLLTPARSPLGHAVALRRVIACGP
jgi:hypothetical protein